MLSSPKLAAVAEIAQSTAWNIQRSLDFLSLPALSMTGQLISSAEFIVSVGKRSRLTPAREHPMAEQDEAQRETLTAGTDSIPDSEAASEIIADLDDEENPADEIPEHKDCGRVSAIANDLARDTVEEDSVLEGLEKKVYDSLPDGEQIREANLYERCGVPTNQLGSVLMMLELKDMISTEFGLITKQKPVEQLPPELASLVKEFLEFINWNFHRISRKYLQLYLAAFWCWKDRSRWGIEQLVEVAHQCQQIGYREIRNYETPAVVRAALD